MNNGQCPTQLSIFLTFKLFHFLVNIANVLIQNPFLGKLFSAQSATMCRHWQALSFCQIPLFSDKLARGRNMYFSIGHFHDNFFTAYAAASRGGHYQELSNGPWNDERRMLRAPKQSMVQKKIGLML